MEKALNLSWYGKNNMKIDPIPERIPRNSEYVNQKKMLRLRKAKHNILLPILWGIEIYWLVSWDIDSILYEDSSTTAL